ncbi:dCTP deaminase, dUMP-forming [subsurface metagenome]
MSILSTSKILSLVTEDIKSFRTKLERGEVPSNILISPFEAESLGPTSYDLHIGERYVSLTATAEPGLRDIGPGRKLVVEPGEAVTLVSKEYIGLPQNIAGMVFSRVSWLELGLSQISTYVHPGFYGPLRETLVNQSNITRELDHGSAFCQIVFLDVPEAKPDERYRGPRRNQKPEQLEKILWGPNPRGVLEREEKIVVLREISKEEAEREILKLFSGGQVLYYSDIAEKLGLDLKLVVEICNELQSKGEIEVNDDALRSR